MNLRSGLARVLAAGAAVCFPIAILLPFFTIDPSFGDPLLDAIIDRAQPGELDPKTFSVVGGIVALIADGDGIIAFVLLCFSVVFPIVKLTLLWTVLARPKLASPHLLRALEALGPWSMADVFVVSVMLLAFKSFPGGTTLTLNSGYFVFLSSVLASLVSNLISAKNVAHIQNA